MHLVKVKLLTLLLIIFVSISAGEHHPSTLANYQENISNAEQEWVDATFNAMTGNERIGQLFTIRAHSDLGQDHIREVERQIKEYHVGGLTFFQGTPEKQVKLTNKYQSLSKVPLMIAVDGEWGLGMRFKDAGISFPKAMTLGAIQDNRILYDMGKEVARQCRRLGIHVNFAPVVDVNNNPENPVINDRSFGEDRYNVAAKSYMYMKGMQDGDVIACAKHFPGHGDTGVDSHYDLPVIPHSRNRLDSIELFPFRVLAQHGIQSMMIAHLQVPNIDNTVNLPTSLSPKAITDILKKEIGFEGLIFTDALEMKGVTKHHGVGEIAAKALLAGADVLCLPNDLKKCRDAIRQYLNEGKISEAHLEQSVKKILRAKYRLGLDNYVPAKEYNVRHELNTKQALALNQKLLEKSMTLVNNADDLIPFRNLNELDMASLSIGAKGVTTFQKILAEYKPMSQYYTGKSISSSKSKELISKLKKKDVVIVGLHDLSKYASKNFGLNSASINFIKTLSSATKVVVVNFGSPYGLKYFDDVKWLLQAYQEDKVAQSVAAQALFGAFEVNGKLPVSASEKIQFNAGVFRPNLFRLGYALPESVGLNSDSLKNIDELVKEALDIKATPGGVVLVAKDGKIVYNKAYGYHTYAKKKKVQKTDIYDLASITKIAAGTVSMMKLYDEGKLSIFNPMSEYVPELRNSAKRDLLVQDMMAHQARLKAWIPFFEQTVSKRKKPLPKFYSSKKNDQFNVEIVKGLYMIESFKDSIWQQIYDSELRSRSGYKYSDLAFYLVADAIQNITQQRIDKYADETFYQKLGLTTMTYNPLEKFSKSRIPPSEDDKYWRHKRVQGYVHDMGAAMLDGVSGHAGLFSNANDLAVLMQMLLNEGYYGGERYLTPETIRLFTNRHQADTRRGIGFDMKELNSSRSMNMSEKASPSTFGHLGFTGTCVWVDPAHNLTYIFLANRTFPSYRRRKNIWGNENFRPRIQSVIYDALK